MYSLRCVLAILMLCIAAGSAAQGHPATAHDGACSDPLLVAFSTDSQFDAACTAFTVCTAAVEDFISCTPHFYAERAALCETGDAVCVSQARLHTALIGLGVGNGYQSHNQPDEFWIDLTAKISDAETLQSTPAREAQDWYRELFRAYGPHPMIQYSFGVLQELAGDVRGAERAYTQASLDASHDPLIYWTRAEFHAAQGNDARAALDYYLTTLTIGAPGLGEAVDAVLSELPAEHRLDLQQAEEVLLYPLFEDASGPGGSSRTDLSSDAPQPYFRRVYGDLLLFYPARFDTDSARAWTTVIPFYAASERADGSYFHVTSDYYNGIGNVLEIDPSRDEEPAHGKLTSHVFEGTTSLDFLIEPVDADDPRLKRARCEGGPLIHLHPGDQADWLSLTEPILLHESPGTDVTLSLPNEGNPFHIKLNEGPECVEGMIWWRITVDGRETGWTTENADSTRYLLKPTLDD